MRKKLVSSFLCLAMAASLLTGCSSNTSSDKSSNTKDTTATSTTETASSDSDTQKGRVGVAMPTKDLQRWNQDGANMKAELEKAGYTVDLQYANNDVGTQVSQIETLISNGADVLVIASIDGESLGDPLSKAKEAGIPVIAYDRLLMNSDAVSYYATFDNYMVGTKQGEYIKDQLDLDNASGPFNLEIFTG
ncbi:MAG TPA: substrate-binding domain-containing protein, partial [Lachnospiraceae bacterium]|nr:substrate-binding domain-containing protein [Lachnospiraceae bacterium]